MKFLLVCIAMGFLLLSCESPLGKDPNVQIEPVDCSVPITEFTEGQYDAYTDFLFKDDVWGVQRFYDMKAVRKVVMLDTTSSTTSLLFDLDYYNNCTDSYYLHYRSDRVMSMKVQFEATLNQTLFNLDGNRKARSWAMITVRKMKDNENFTYIPTQIPVMVLIDDNNRTKNYIWGSIIFDLTGLEGLGTKKFVCWFGIKYRK